MGKIMGPGITEALVRYDIENQDKIFSDFLDSHTHNGKWFIASDFCIDNKEYKTNTCAVTFIPISAHPKEISDKISAAIPKDLKHTKIIDPKIIDLIKDKEIFHFVFILDGHREVISGSTGLGKLEATRQYIKILVETLQSANYPIEVIRPFRKLLQASKAKNFNFNLFSDMVAVSAILGFASSALIRRGSNLIGLFPDRDKMTEWCDAIYSDLVRLYVDGVLEQVDGRKYNYELKRAVDFSQGKAAWFDSFVRLPDYLAGIIAGWDVEKNTINGDKRTELFMGNIVDSQNVIVLRLLYDGELHLERVVANSRQGLIRDGGAV